MKVHIHTNCQSIPLAGLLKEAQPGWDISYFEAHAGEIIDRIDEHHSLIRTADLVISQPIHNGYRERTDLSIDWVRENVRANATLLVFPSIHFTGHHPGLDELPLQGIPFLSSLLAAHLIASGLTPTAALDHFLSEQLLRDEDIEVTAAVLAAHRLITQILVQGPSAGNRLLLRGLGAGVRCRRRREPRRHDNDSDSDRFHDSIIGDTRFLGIMKRL